MLSSLGRRDKDGAMTRPVGVRKNTLVAGRKAICTLSAHLFTTWTLPRRADTRQWLRVSGQYRKRMKKTHFEQIFDRQKHSKGSATISWGESVCCVQVTPCLRFVCVVPSVVCICCMVLVQVWMPLLHYYFYRCPKRAGWSWGGKEANVTVDQSTLCCG